jgi:hypothetical protein
MVSDIKLLKMYTDGLLGNGPEFMQISTPEELVGLVEAYKIGKVINNGGNVVVRHVITRMRLSPSKDQAATKAGKSEI